MECNLLVVMFRCFVNVLTTTTTITTTTKRNTKIKQHQAMNNFYGNFMRFFAHFLFNLREKKSLKQLIYEYRYFARRENKIE